MSSRKINSNKSTLSEKDFSDKGLKKIGVRTQKITIMDIPYRIDKGFTSWGDQHAGLKTGAIVSEVGDPIPFSVDFYPDLFPAFMLRKSRANKLPKHIFGGAMLGETFAGFLPEPVAVPAVNTTVIVDPVVTKLQYNFLEAFQYFQADGIYIVHCPSPINTSLYLEAFAPEFDSTTQTRGVKWKPIDHPTIAFILPWSSDLSVHRIDSARPGQSGLSLAIRTIADNTADSITKPLELVIYKAVFNINATGMFLENARNGQPLSGLNFTPLKPKTTFEDDPVERQSGSEAAGQVSVEIDSEMPKVIEELAPTLEVTTEAEAPSKEAKPTEPKKNVSKGQQRKPNTKWMDFQLVTLPQQGSATWNTVEINPIMFNRGGENLALGFRRNLWVTGEQTGGYSRQIAWLINTHRPATAAGVVEVLESANELSHVSIVELGTGHVFGTIPRRHAAEAVKQSPRDYNSPWMRTNESRNAFKYRLIALNRGVDAVATTLRVQVKPGASNFSVPTKPKKALTTYVQNVMESIQSYLDPVIRQSGHQYAPEAGMFAEEGEINEGGAEDDELQNDGFPIEIFRGEVVPGTITAIPLIMPSLVDLTGDDTVNVITEKFRRMAHVVPTEAGDLGPVIGDYVIMSRLPTSVAANIEHVAIPGDLNDEAALRIFGFGELASLATTAISALGGPALGGIVNTAVNTVSSLLGLGNTPPAQNSTPSANPPAISGPIPVSRHPVLLKPVEDNELEEPTFGSLLVNIRDLLSSFGARTDKVPISVFVKMGKTKFERSIFDRSVENTLPNEIIIPKDRIPYMVGEMLLDTRTFQVDTKQYINFHKLFSLVRKERPTKYITVKAVVDYVLDDVEVQSNVELLNARVFEMAPY